MNESVDEIQGGLYGIAMAERTVRKSPMRMVVDESQQALNNSNEETERRRCRTPPTLPLLSLHTSHVNSQLCIHVLLDDRVPRLDLLASIMRNAC